MSLLSAAASAPENRLPACAAVIQESFTKLCCLKLIKICRTSATCIHSPLPTLGKHTDTVSTLKHILRHNNIKKQGQLP